MYALLLKDFYNLKKQIKLLLVFAVFYGIISVFTENMSLLISILCVLASMLPVNSITFDHYAKWDNYALTLPITRKQIIGAKYLFFLIAIGMVLVLSTIVQTLYVFAIGKDSFEGHFPIVLLAIATASLFINSIIIPIVIKLGAEKARILTVGIFLIPTALIVIGAKLGVPLPDQETLLLLLKLLPVIALTCTGLSYWLSVKWYCQKEF